MSCFWEQVKEFFGCGATNNVRRAIYKLNYRSESDSLWFMYEGVLSGNVVDTFDFFDLVIANQPQGYLYAQLEKVLYDNLDDIIVYKRYEQVKDFNVTIIITGTDCCGEPVSINTYAVET